MRISDWSSDVCSSDLLPPLTAWPDDLAQQIGGDIFLLPGGYEVDGREIAPFDERKVRAAAQVCRERGIDRIAVSSAFAPVNAPMEERAADGFDGRSEERRVGKGCVSPCRSRGAPEYQKTKQNTIEP